RQILQGGSDAEIRVDDSVDRGIFLRTRAGANLRHQVPRLYPDLRTRGRHLHLVRVHVDGSMPSDSIRASGAVHQQSVLFGSAGAAERPRLLMSIDVKWSG